MADAPLKSISFYQIFFKEQQLQHIYPFATSVYNDTLTPFFENTLIAELVPRSKSEYTAVCSWQLRLKMTLNLPPRRPLTEELLQSDYDVLSFTKNTKTHNALAFLYEKHKGAREILETIWRKLGLTLPSVPKYPIYQNAFCARTDIYQQYVRECLVPAMDLMANDEHLKEMCWQDAQYTASTLGRKVDFDRIEKFLGVRYYPLHPFICERFFTCWIDNRNYNVQYV